MTRPKLFDAIRPFANRYMKDGKPDTQAIGLVNQLADYLGLDGSPKQTVDPAPSLAIRTTDINALIDDVIKREGGYVNHPHDKGGETNWGITVAVARANGYQGPMKQLPRATAVQIYRKLYWEAPGFDKVAAIYPRVGAELFDTGINMGQSVAGRFLQRALNAFQDAGLAQDGRVGPATIRALEGFKRVRKAPGEQVMVAALDCLQGARYIELVEGRQKNRSFVFGWFAHRIGQA
jgi:lysozyme family protein